MKIEEIVELFYQFRFYSIVTLIPIGIVGNIISLFIFTRPSFNQKTNTGLLYTLFCAINLITLVYVASFKNVNSFTEFNIELPLSVQELLEYILFQSLSWVQVIISVDRFIAVLYPVKGVRFMSKRWVLYSIILGLFIVIIGVNSPFFVRITVTEKDEYNRTVTHVNFMTYKFYTINYYIRNFMRIYIPYLIIVIVDIMVIIRLKKSRTKFNQRQNRQVSNTANRSSRFTRNTILIDLIYLIFNIPSTSYTNYIIIYFSLKYAGIQIGLPSPYYELLAVLLSSLAYYYLTLNFLLFLLFNRIFRSEFITLFRFQKFFNFVTSTNS